MRLPENSQERTKIFALAGLAAVGVLYGLWIGVYKPIDKARANTEKKIAAMESEMMATRAQIGRMGEMRRELRELSSGLRDRSEQDMLHPSLGNYLLQARELLSAPGAAAGAEGIVVTEIGPVDPPSQSKKEKTHVVRAYSARVVAECGFDALVSWLRALETQNSLIAVSHFTVSAQAEKPEMHQVRFEVQWPTWVDPTMREQVRASAAQALEESAP